MKTSAREIPTMGLSWRGPLTLGLLLLLIALVATCNGPTYPPLQVQAVTVATHTRDYFPISHGASENPSGDCNVCHGGFSSFEGFSCLGCHAHDKASTDGHHGSLVGYSYDSNACYSCHPTGEGGLDRDEHSTRYFPINTGTAHVNTDCTGCHTTGDYGDVTCIDCHAHLEPDMSSEHQGITGYAYQTSSCLSCHPSGTANLSRDDHTTRYFPINTGTAHVDTDCTGCHNTGDYGQVTCIDCHAHLEPDMNSEHQGITGYAYQTSSCLSCHPTGGPALTRDDHTTQYFPITSGSAHVDTDCSGCHNTGDYSKYTCTDCHAHLEPDMNAVHQGFSGYAYQTSSCITCHPTGSAADAAVSEDEHTAKYFPINTGTVHQSQACAECHTTGSFGTFECIDCHTHNATAMNGAHNDVNNYAFKSPNCYSCHPDSVVLTRSEHTPWFPITSGDHSRYGCDDCHTTQGTYQQFTCIGCHAGEHTCARMNDKHLGEVRNYTCEDSACLSCHPTGKED